MLSNVRCLLLIGLFCVFCHTVGAQVTPLTKYVQAPDPTYKWNVSSKVVDLGVATVYNIYLTSQTWLTAKDSDRSVWTHWLQVCIPAFYKDETAFIWIGSGENMNFDQPPDDFGTFGTFIDGICVTSQSVVGLLHQIPNEPITFTDDPLHKRRIEDEIIAYTWAHMLNHTNEPNWLLRFPMVKSVIKAMDAMQEFAQQKAGIDIKYFVPAGASKRGWTTWMVGAVGDPRVIAICPIVAPVANVVPQFNEQYRSYGEFSFAIKPYAEQRVIPGWLNKPDLPQAVLKYIDPLTYPETLGAIPKYLIIASQDEFFMPDSPKYFWNNITGEKYLWIVQNADHSLFLNIEEVAVSITEYYLSVLDKNRKHDRPTYHWNITNDGRTIRFTDTSQKGNIDSAYVWISQDNPNRDWRFITCSSIPECLNLDAYFIYLELEPISPGVYEYTMQDPAPGKYTAFYIEVQYNVVDHIGSLRVTSNMAVLPYEKYPYPPCGKKCDCGWNCSSVS